MREKSIDWNPNKTTQGLLGDIDSVLSQYKALGIRLTLRQLYYQLVTKNIIANRKSEYAKLSSILTDARMSGRIDWEAIEDRVRRPEKHAEWSSIADLVNSAVYSYRSPRWEHQQNYVELWCEKDAIHSVIQPITDDLHVTLMVNRGYSSASAMYDSSKRFIEASDSGKECFLLYLGDFDPSGEDMVRDIGSRLNIFGATTHVEKIALTSAQVAQYNPPPNPVKITDPRAGAFIAKYGSSSYEVDALNPQVLMKLVRTPIEDLMDMDAYNACRTIESAGKEKLIKAAKNI